MKQLESEQLLSDCRDLLTNRMKSSMSRMMGEIEDTLFELATREYGADQTSHYIDAVREFRMKKCEIQVRFENRLQNLFDYSLRENKKGNQVNIIAAIVPYTDNILNVEKNCANQYRQSVEKLRDECRSTLVKLDKYVSELLSNVPVDNFYNPVQPATVISAFQESCCDIQVSPDIRQLLVNMFDKHMGPTLQRVYEDLNTLFQSYPTNTETRSTPIDIDYPGIVINPEPGPEQLADQSTAHSSLLVGKWIKDRIMSQLQGSQVPGFVHEFLLTSWYLVLERIYAKQGAAGTEWYRATQLVIDLVECSRLTNEKNSRRQQIWMLPGLIYRLKAGMKTVAIPLKQQTDFLSRLKIHHASITESCVIPGKSDQPPH